jgi:hypothetical protein
VHLSQQHLDRLDALRWTPVHGQHAACLLGRRPLLVSLAALR